MKNLAKKGGYIWVTLAIIPITAFIYVIGNALHLDSNIMLIMQLPALILQLFSAFMVMRYWREIL